MRLATDPARRREHLAGGLVVLLGIAAILEGRRLGVGSLTSMGPGYLPIAIGILLVVLGIIIALQKPQRPALPLAGEAAAGGFEWRGWTCIILGVISFIALSDYVGLIAATLVSVFVAAMGDRTNTPLSAAKLAAGATVFGVVLFHSILQIPIPLVSWDFS
jgi:putative Ca2+/H+ antiporter (TMEM165/GDT1 family)